MLEQHTVGLAIFQFKYYLILQGVLPFSSKFFQRNESKWSVLEKVFYGDTCT